MQKIKRNIFNGPATIRFFSSYTENPVKVITEDGTEHDGEIRVWNKTASLHFADRVISAQDIQNNWFDKEFCVLELNENSEQVKFTFIIH